MKQIKYNSVINLLNDIYSLNGCYVFPTITNKYTVVDKAMFTVYLYKFFCIENKLEEDFNTTLSILYSPIIQSEYGYLNLSSLSKKRLDVVMPSIYEFIETNIEKKNKQYDFFNLDINVYKNSNKDLINIINNISEIFMLLNVYYEGYSTIKVEINERLNKILEFKGTNKEIDELIDSISLIDIDKGYDYLITDTSIISKYYKMIQVPTRLSKLVRFSRFDSMLKESVLTHSYIVSILSYFITEYMNCDNIDKNDIINMGLFHDFYEFKGDDLPSIIKRDYDFINKINDEIEEDNKEELTSYVGNTFIEYANNYKKGLVGYIVDNVDKMSARMKMYIEITHYNNFNYIKDYLRNKGSYNRIKKSIIDERYVQIKNTEVIYKLNLNTICLACESIMNNYKSFINDYIPEKEIKDTLEILKEIKSEKPII